MSLCKVLEKGNMGMFTGHKIRITIIYMLSKLWVFRNLRVLQDWANLQTIRLIYWLRYPILTLLNS